MLFDLEGPSASLHAQAEGNSRRHHFINYLNGFNSMRSGQAQRIRRVRCGTSGTLDISITLGHALASAITALCGP